MLFPQSPLDFVEAIERERRESLRTDANRIAFFRRLAFGLSAASQRLRMRRPRVEPRPA